MKKIIAAILLVGASLGAQTLLRSYAVVNLPSAASQNGNTLFVNNGSSATDCTVGGGLYLVPCRSNGSAWSVQSTSGSSAWSALTSGTNTTGAFLIGTGASLGPTGTGTIKATGVLASAGPTPTADGAIAYDTTNLWYAAGLGSATVKFPWWNGTLGSGNCAQWSGTGGHLIDSGSPCGSGSGITQLTGDVTAGPGSGSQAATLATSGVTAGSYTNANITVDAKGRVTAAANGSSSGGVSSFGGQTGAITLGGSGALGMTGNVLDVVTAIVPLVANANTFAGLQTFTKPVIYNTNAVASSATPAFNLLLGKFQITTLTANITGFTISGLTTSGEWCFDFVQDATGSRTLSGAPSAVHGLFTIGSTASKQNVQCFYSPDGTNLYAESAGQTNQ